MTIEIIKNKILAIAPDAIEIENSQIPTFQIPSEKLYQTAKTLKESKETNFDYLFCLTGIDLEDKIGIVYHLESTNLGYKVVLKVETSDRNNPEFDSVSSIWQTAEFHEREVFDFFGIKFKGHPDLRRIFLDEDWEGYPLRKDYVDEKNMIIR